MKNTGRIKSIISIICIVVIAISLFIWTFNKQKEENRWFAVFVPGVMANSPVYSMLAEGVSQAVLDYNENNNTNYKVEVIEAGTNQAEWGAKLTGLAAMKKFEVIFSSNPSIPDLAASITEIYPEQKFIILDSFYEGNPNIATVRFNQREQSYLAGYAAGLATTSKDSQMEFSNPQKKIALISAQEYPVMNEIILPGFIEGAKAVDNDIEVIFKIVGNWYDANKGAEISRSLYNEGVDVILPICGGASQGVIATAKELGFYISWFDDNGFSKAPGYVISSSAMEQEKMAYEVATKYFEGKIEFGTATTVDIKDGYVTLITDDPIFENNFSDEYKSKLIDEYLKIKNGELVLEAPEI
jgi:simple sugar transport system substrate-binding protein